jgi:hypothetical protein
LVACDGPSQLRILPGLSMTNRSQRDDRDGAALTINARSSSVKFALFSLGNPPVRRFPASVQRIALADPTLSIAEGTDGRRETSTGSIWSTT